MTKQSKKVGIKGKSFHIEPPDQKDQYMFEASTLLKVFDKVLKLKDEHISNLETTVRQKNERISNLEAAVRQKNERISNLEAAVRQKNEHISNLENHMREKESALAHIYNSEGWKVLLAYYKIRDKILPPNSKVKKAIKFIWNVLLNRSHKKGLVRIPEVGIKEKAKFNDPLISVVIPIYDRTDLLRESIESILNQTFENFELLLVCDGSPTETIYLVNEYRSHPKVRIFMYKNNSGNPVRGRNKGIREAKGAYIVFQDSDDIAEPYRLEVSYKYAKEHNADVVYGMWKVKKEKGASDYHTDLTDGQIVHSPDCNYQSLKTCNFICQSTAMVKTDALRKAGGLKADMHYCEDYELWLRLAYLGYTFKSISKTLTTLRLHAGNLEGKFKKDEEAYRQKALAEHTVIPRWKPSIAFIIPGQGISGGIMVICQHANRLIKKGYDVVLINNNIKDPFKLDWFPDLLTEVIPVDKVNHNIDIAIATQWSTAYAAKDFPARRKLYFIQSDETRFYPQGSKEAELALMTYTFDFEFIVIAQWLRNWVQDNFNKSAYYVPNGLDSSIFYPDKPLTPKGDKLRVLLEGPVDIPYKGMKEAFQVVAGMDCEVWCVSSSGRPKRGWKCDRFFEKVPLEKMRQIYSSCDVLIKMSKVEGFFMPPLEMMACGGTVITSKVTGCDEYIIDCYNGLVVDQRDIESARKKLNQLIADRELLNRLKKGGLDTAKNWTWEYSNNRFEEIIKKEAKQKSEPLQMNPIESHTKISNQEILGIIRLLNWHYAKRTIYYLRYGGLETTFWKVKQKIKLLLS